MRKTIYLLNIGDYAPELTALTYPHIEFWASKIGADVHVINERKFPDWDLDYEKLQIHELAEQRGDDWSIYIDSDALVHPETPDPTIFLSRDTVAHNGADFGPLRWQYDQYFLRDGRHLGSCNWLAIASDWCRDLWRPLDDLTPVQAYARITTTVEERNPKMQEDDGSPRDGVVVRREHLVSDYVVSRNIARFGLKFTTLNELWPKIGLEHANFFHHEYTVSLEAKTERIRQTIERWRL